MAVKIRLQRHGSKKKPFYRIVVADKSSPRDGRFIEVVGTYNPLTDPPKIEIRRERVNHWISNGAVPSGTVKQLLKKVGAAKEEAA